MNKAGLSNEELEHTAAELVQSLDPTKLVHGLLENHLYLYQGVDFYRKYGHHFDPNWVATIDDFSQVSCFDEPEDSEVNDVEISTHEYIDPDQECGIQKIISMIEEDFPSQIQRLSEDSENQEFVDTYNLVVDRFNLIFDGYKKVDDLEPPDEFLPEYLEGDFEQGADYEALKSKLPELVKLLLQEKNRRKKLQISGLIFFHCEEEFVKLADLLVWMEFSDWDLTARQSLERITRSL